MNVKKILMFICFLVLFFLVASQTRAWERPGVKTGMERAEPWTRKEVGKAKGFDEERFEGKGRPPTEGGLQPTGPKPLPSDEPESEPKKLKRPLKIKKPPLKTHGF